MLDALHSLLGLDIFFYVIVIIVLNIYLVKDKIPRTDLTFLGFMTLNNLQFLVVMDILLLVFHDGTGIMGLIMTPVALIYTMGYLQARRLAKEKKDNPEDKTK